MIEELKVIITAEIDSLKKELKKGQEELKKTASTSETAGQKIGKALKAAGSVVATATKAMVGAVAAVGAAVVAVTESTREYRTQQALLTSSFQTAGGSAETAKETYNDLFRVLGDSGKATEAAQHLAQLTTEEQALSEWTTICQGVYATFGDSLPIESLTEAANETAKTGELTGALADALNWAGISEQEFADKLFMCNSEAEREALIRETLSGIYDDAAVAYEKNAASVLAANEAQLALTDTLAQVGGMLEPVVTIFKQGLTTALQGLLPGLSQVAQGFTDMITGVEGGAETMKQGIDSLVKSVIDTITSMLPMVLDIGLDIIVALIEGIAAALPDLIGCAGDILVQIVDVLKTLLPMIIGVILDSLPEIINVIVEVVVEVLNLLGEILPQIIDKIVDILPVIVETLLDNIPVLLDAALSLFMTLVNAIPEILPPLLDALPTIIQSVLNFLLDNTPMLLDAAIQAYMAFVFAIPEIIPQLLSSLGTIVSTIANTLGDKLPEMFKNIWSTFTKGSRAAFEGMKNTFQSIPNWFKNVFASAWQAVKDVFSARGKIFDGIKDGILSGLKTVINGLIGGINKVIAVPFNGINSALQKIKGVSIAGLKPFDWIPTISVPQIPKMAKGGVIDTATLAMIGEAGKEAVVPLENNTEWMDGLISRLVEALTGTNRPIILQVDGKTFAKTSLKTINELTKQTGKLDLVIPT